jgi:DNA repair protein SbcC/Rad50
VAETELVEANAELDAVQGDCVIAGRLLSAARERVAPLAPPVPSGAGLLADWQQLTAWATDEARVRGAEWALVEDDRMSLDARRCQLDKEARQRVTAVLEGDTSGVELAVLAEHLVAAETRARGAMERFEEERKRLAELRKRIEGMQHSAAVADKLGNLLRADGFERWLMASALQGLVDAASVRLRELTGGQFSLVLHEGTFAVRDHANADEVRRARTLSGGETFLAALSLALALADATAELAPEGAPTIESIFLDEGFGALDPQTLDTVATAVEELGATGRMVGIVTHIRELADRMPVRLEVTKTANTSAVVRVEA